MRRITHFTVCVLLLLCSCSGFCTPRTVGIVAHRGYWNCEEGGYSHNSIAALRAAGENGFWGSEFDVNMTSDGSLLVFHDSKIDGKRISDYAAEEFAEHRLPNGESIPTLDEFLSVAAEYPNTMLVLELKKHPTSEMEKSAADKCIAALKRHGLYSPERVMFISFSEYACRYFAENAYGFIVQYLADDRSVDQLAAGGINGIDLQYKRLLGDEKWMKDARDFGFSVNVWTVNNDNDIHSVIEAGVDFITTDNPQRVREILGDTELRRCSPSLTLTKSSRAGRKSRPTTQFQTGNSSMPATESRFVNQTRTVSQSQTANQSKGAKTAQKNQSEASNNALDKQTNRPTTCKNGACMHEGIKHLERVLKDGDIIFIAADDSPMSAAITASTSASTSATSSASISSSSTVRSASAKSFDHCAVYHAGRNGKGYVIEASPSYGVRKLRLEDFIAEILSDATTTYGDKIKESHKGSKIEENDGSKENQDSDKSDLDIAEKITVMRVSAAGFDSHKSIKAVLSHIGEEYDWQYLPDNGKSYCSELVQESYQDKDGNLIFEAAPMNFLDSDGNLPDFWKNVFDGKTAVPQGVPGSNPNMLAASPKLIDISYTISTQIGTATDSSV